MIADKVVFVLGRLNDIPRGLADYEAAAKELMGAGLVPLSPVALPRSLPMSAYLTLCASMLSVSDGVLILGSAAHDLVAAQLLGLIRLADKPEAHSVSKLKELFMYA